MHDELSGLLCTTMLGSLSLSLAIIRPFIRCQEDYLFAYFGLDLDTLLVQARERGSTEDVCLKCMAYSLYISIGKCE